ncbi:hypothetical protein JCM10295v2_002201 [Rhodotorula toruloides]
MPHAEDSPPSKRRRTVSPSPHSRHASYSQASRSPEDARSRRRNPLEGFDPEAEESEDARDRRDLSDGERGDEPEEDHVNEEDEEELCAICLSPIENRTVIFPCHHGQFCWQCIRAWTDQSRKCPLCLGPIEHLIHNIRSSKDYQTHYLLPLHTIASSSSADDLLPARGSRRPAVNPTLPRHALYGRNRYSSAARLNDLDETTWREREEERALERRRFIYREGLYAKHVASNRYTGFKPFTPQTFASNPDLKARVIKFIRRELQVFPAVDVAFLTTYLVSIASQLDLRSAAAIRLVSDFLSEQDAQHLVHEIVTFARSPFASLEGYDRFVQYGRPTREVPKAQELEEMSLTRATAPLAFTNTAPGPKPQPVTMPFSPCVAHPFTSLTLAETPEITSRQLETLSFALSFPHETPPPPDDPELRDAISLAVPVLSANPSPRPASPARNSTSSAKGGATQQQSSQRPMLNIFGAARRILGNGRVVTLSEDGKASLQTDATGWKDGGLAISGRARHNGKGRAVRPTDQEPYDAAPSRRPHSPAAKNLLARLGGIAPSPAPSSTSASASTADASSSQESLRAKLQARLTAEYRQALASKTNGPSTSSALDANGKMDLRSMLQQRLQAEKALAYEDLVRSRASASLAAARAASTTAQTDSLASFVVGGLDGRLDAEGQTTYSQATRDLLMARLEEEKLLAADELTGDFAVDYGDSYDLDYGDFGNTIRILTPGREEARPPAADEPKQPSKSESSLKAALLAKRQAAVEDELEKKSGELKEKLMRQKLLQARAKAQGGKAATSGGAAAEKGGGAVGGAQAA